ncbi:hypothetical protein JW859_11340 [bacterium]|nr:hypothetical protein [bacterium]
MPDQRSVAEAPVPDGVDPGVFELLRTELLRILDERSVDSRQASFTPYGTANQIDDLTLTGSGPYRLTWTYRNIGDYDFNGQVNVSDLTPIGVYFGMSESDPLWPLACTADGDGNGLITVSDITPLGQNFGGTIVGYQVWGTDQREGEWNFLGNATVETNLRKNALRPRFVIQLSTLDYTYLGLWPYDNSDDEGWWSNTATLGQSEPRYIVGMRSIWDAGS